MVSLTFFDIKNVSEFKSHFPVEEECDLFTNVIFNISFIFLTFL